MSSAPVSPPSAPGASQRPAMRIRAELPPDRAATCLERGRFLPPPSLGRLHARPEALLAMDAAFDSCLLDQFLAENAMAGSTSFIGYAACANLSQNGLMRAAVETLADEMTRRFVRLVNTGPAAHSQELADLEQELRRLDARSVFNRAASMCGYFGGCLVFLDMGVTDPGELAAPLALSPLKIPARGLRRLTLIEPVNIYPGDYNTTDPLRDDYFAPESWHVLGRRIHASRFLRFTANEPPLLLKPAYNFLGIPTVQFAVDYVANFTATREAAARLLRKFSLTALKTNMDSLLYGGSGNEVQRRLEFFARFRDNDGVFALDRETEDLVQLNTPLSGVNAIVRQALELLAAIWRIPAVKLLGISPSGFNATGAADMRNFYDFVASQQAKVFAAPLDRLLRILQISLFREVRPGIRPEFLPLWEMTDQERAAINKTNADADAALLDRGCLQPAEVRARLRADPGSGYNALVSDPSASR